jgi:hypothetical protein
MIGGFFSSPIIKQTYPSSYARTQIVRVAQLLLRLGECALCVGGAGACELREGERGFAINNKCKAQ